MLAKDLSESGRDAYYLVYKTRFGGEDNGR